MAEYNSGTHLHEVDVMIIPCVQQKNGSVQYVDEHRSYFSIPSTTDFAADAGQTILLYPPDSESQRVFLVGLGKMQGYTIRAWKKAIGSAVLLLQSKKYTTCSLFIPRELLDMFGARRIAKETVLAIEIAAYSFDEHKEESARVTPLAACHFDAQLVGAEKNAFQKGVEEGVAISEGIYLTRTLGNTPPTVMTPTFLAFEAMRIAKGNSSLTVKVYGKKEITDMGMGCLLGVAKGSELEPKFIVLEYMGTDVKKAPSILVGKGITFDSGGLSLKPGDYMVNMKFDMLGAGTVLGIMHAASLLKLKKNLVAIIPSCENMPSGTSYRPDDILTAMNGKTVEIQNTDAEGRLVLADAFCYAVKHYPHAKEMIDFATLTGACVVALGNERSGLFSPHDPLAQALYESAEIVGEQLWRLPLGEEYSDAMKSMVADIKNLGGVGGDRYAGASTAAAFLQYFTLQHHTEEKKPMCSWAHIDLSCSYYSGKGHSWIRHGANGFGVQTLIEYFS